MPDKIPIQTFVLDDDFILLENIKELFEIAEITNCSLFTNEEDFFKAFNRGVMVCVIDYWLKSNVTGIDVIKKILEINARCRIIVISAKEIELSDLITVKNYGPIPFLSKTSERFVDDLITFVKRSVNLAIAEKQLYHEIMKKVAV